MGLKARFGSLPTWSQVWKFGVLAQCAPGMALAEDAVWGGTRNRTGNVPIAPNVMAHAILGVLPCAETRFKPSRLEFSKGVSVGILKRITLTVTGLLFAALATLLIGGVGTASAAAAPATSSQSMPIRHGHGHHHGHWNDCGCESCCVEVCCDDCCDDCCW